MNKPLLTATLLILGLALLLVLFGWSGPFEFALALGSGLWGALFGVFGALVGVGLALFAAALALIATVFGLIVAVLAVVVSLGVIALLLLVPLALVFGLVWWLARRPTPRPALPRPA